MIRFHKKYFLYSIVLFLIEVFIGFFVHDNFIRPYIGDLLVVILIYCTIRSFFATPVLATAIATLVFAYLIELAQYFRIVELLGLAGSNLASTLIGTSFAWLDIVAYTAGIGLVLFAEYGKTSRQRQKPG